MSHPNVKVGQTVTLDMAPRLDLGSYASIPNMNPKHDLSLATLAGCRIFISPSSSLLRLSLEWSDAQVYEP